MTPGVQYGVPIEDYHNSEGISKTGLDAIERSPAIYYALNLAPYRPPPPEPTPAMRIGTMTHAAILEPAELGNRYAVGPNVSTKSAKGWKDFLATIAPGIEAITEAELAQIKAMAASVRAIAPLRDLLAKGDPEVSAYFIDAPTGVLCRCRPDWVSPAGDGVIIVDVKTTTDASPDAFARSVANYGYSKQAALYSDGFAAASDQTVHGFVFAVVEKDWPFAAAAYMIDEESLEYGRRQYRANLATYAECLRTNTWPGYTADDEIRLLTMPTWAMKESA